VSEDPVSKDFVDRAIKAERAVTDKQFEARDKAIGLLADNVSSQKAVHIAIGIALLSFLLSAALGVALVTLKFLVR
jgi:hypothetical protein